MRSLYNLLLWTFLFLTAQGFAGDMAGVPPKPYPPLSEMVRSADLILRCRMEVKKGEGSFRVIEVWKGEYQPAMFKDEYAGRIRLHGNNTLSGAWHTRIPVHKEEIHFIKLDLGTEYRTLEAFPLIEGKITYPKTVLWGKKLDTVERTYTADEFKSAIARELSRP